MEKRGCACTDAVKSSRFCQYGSHVIHEYCQKKEETEKYTKDAVGRGSQRD